MLSSRRKNTRPKGVITCQASFVDLDKKLSNPIGLLNFLEAPPGIGPGIKVLQTSALPLGYGAVQWSKPFGARRILTKILSDPWLLQVTGTTGRTRSSGADYGDRTRHLDLGKVALYQMS